MRQPVIVRVSPAIQSLQIAAVFLQSIQPPVLYHLLVILIMRQLRPIILPLQLLQPTVLLQLKLLRSMFKMSMMFYLLQLQIQLTSK
ncbi:MAG: hypothetical protein ED559_14115 [Phycisphaera sp.]|nr:MAG: hypothetical protein ED559_14115 [Phycisphaera sp.]